MYWALLKMNLKASTHAEVKYVHQNLGIPSLKVQNVTGNKVPSIPYVVALVTMTGIKMYFESHKNKASGSHGLHQMLHHD